MEDIKDLEQELGCSIEVVFKAVKNGIYVDNNKKPTGVILTANNYDCVYVLQSYNREIAVYPRGYKKTWWLKEDKSE